MNQQLKTDRILHGCDYNPDQWLDYPDILEEDIRLMRKAHVNSVALGIFSWSRLEPRDGEYHFSWLREIMDRLWAAGIHTELATPSGARPAWLDAAYPEAMRVSKNGQRDRHGRRHNHCMTSTQYRHKVSELDRRLAEEFGSHPGLLLWHISNEFGGECYCPLCAEKFREWLRQRYHNDIDQLNAKWWTSFWSHHYDSFDQIDPPFAHGEDSIQGHLLDWRRFTSWNTVDFMRTEIEAIRAGGSQAPVTTNFMSLYNGIDYHQMSRELNVISWDSYPAWHGEESVFQTACNTAFEHAMMRGCRPDRPFLLMESTPSLPNWHQRNKLKRPGIHRLASLQATACGSDGVQYFQWRKSRGAEEQFHGAVVDHAGADNRVFREVTEVGELLEKLSTVCGSLVRSQAAMVFDWDNRWALDHTSGLIQDNKGYVDCCQEYYSAFTRNGVELDVISVEDDFSRYRLLVLPMLFLTKPGFEEKLEKFIQDGGHVVGTFLLGYVDESTLCRLGGFPGGRLKELFGVQAEEIDTLYPDDRNEVAFEGGIEGTCSVRDYCELLNILDENTQVLGRYRQDFYAGRPVITRKRIGSGCAWYAAARLDRAGVEKLLYAVWQDAGMEPKVLPENVEYHCRQKGNVRYHFYLNWGDTAAKIQPPANTTDLLSGEVCSGGTALPRHAVRVLQEIISPH